MIHLLDNYTFSPSLRYDAHRLVYTYSEKEEPIQIEGFLGATLLCVRLINSDEGERREIPLDIERKQDFFFSRYEQEVIADGWGYLEAELRQLNDAYIQLTVSQVPIVDVCANIRQFSIAMSLLSAYMQRLVIEELGEHIWEKETWHMPDNVLTCPTEDTEDRYAATREYIKERKRYDKEFRIFVKNSSHAKLCRQLTLLFGWYVEPSALRKSLLRSPKRKTKKYT